MKTKRLVALVLALTLVFCFMAMSASAATTEVQPRGTCNYCKYGYVTTEMKYVNTTYPAVTSCPYRNIPHNHTQTNYKVIATCGNCRCSETSKVYTTYCPYEDA